MEAQAFLLKAFNSIEFEQKLQILHILLIKLQEQCICQIPYQELRFDKVRLRSRAINLQPQRDH